MMSLFSKLFNWEREKKSDFCCFFSEETSVVDVKI